MLELLKEIILDAQSSELFTGVYRHLKISGVPHKATIIIGVRRCGKSTFLNQIAEKLLSTGIPKENILSVNFFDDRLSPLKSLGLDLVLQAYYSLFPYKKSAEKVYYFFDEIQAMPNWEAFVDRCLRTENCEIYISGSSAQMLSVEIATQMRGRALSWELFPFSFMEFADYHHVKSSPPFNTMEKLILKNAFDQYWESGGFPEVAALEKPLRIKIHQEYFNTILYRDLIERYDISHPRALTDLARKLAENIASFYTINSLTGYLKSIGHNVPKSSVSEYLKWFEDAYFLMTVRLYDASWQRSNANAKKIYAVDHALVRSVSSGILVNSGHLLENLVFTCLRRLTAEVFYYRTSGNHEVDFLIKNKKGQLLIFQVCETLADPVTRKREIRALQAAMSELNLDKSIIITRDEQESIQVETGVIEVLPVWKFLLEFRS